MKISEVLKLKDGDKVSYYGNVYTVKSVLPYWDGFKLSRDNRKPDGYVIESYEDSRNMIGYKKLKKL